MISLILIILGAFFNAVQDTTYSHFTTSIFRRWDPKFWKALESWAFARRILGYPLDAWHISKSLWLICLLAAVVFYTPIWGILDFFLFIGVWGIVFNLFYEVILKRK